MAFGPASYTEATGDLHSIRQRKFLASDLDVDMAPGSALSGRTSSLSGFLGDCIGSLVRHVVLLHGLVIVIMSSLRERYCQPGFTWCHGRMR